MKTTFLLGVLCYTVFLGAVYSQECGSDQEFLCEASGACINSTRVCDGISDCLNGTDEIDCGPSTTTDCPGFECPSGFCIPSVWLCDGDNDCGDMSDEQDCPETTTTECSAFQCNDGSCIPNEWQCDAEFDCQDGEDEAGCPCNGFHCPSGICIPSGWTCDGDDDCGDMSDEKEEACPCNDDEYRCSSSETGTPGACIPSEHVCDEEGIWDCRDGSDETNCTTSAQSTTPMSPIPVKRARQQRPSSVRAANIRRLTKATEKKAMQQRYAAKKQSTLYYNNKQTKKA